MPETISLSEPVALPSIWQKLLDIEDFEAMPEDQYPSKFRGDPANIDHIFDPTPFRDDARSVRFERGDFLITYNLLSANGNYWLSSTVDKKESSAKDFNDADVLVEDCDPSFDLPSGTDAWDLPNGKTLSVPVILAESPAPAA